METVFQAIIDFINEYLIERLLPFYIMVPWHGGIVLRLGKFHKKLKPGFNWKCILIDDINTCSIVFKAANLPEQSLRTKDNKDIIASFTLCREIVSPEKYLLGVYDEDTVLNTVVSLIPKVINKFTYEEISVTATAKVESEINKVISRKIKKWGIRLVHPGVSFTDFPNARSIRLFTQNVSKEVTSQEPHSI